MKSSPCVVVLLALVMASVSCSDKGNDENQAATATARSNAGLSAATDGVPGDLPQVRSKNLETLVDLVVADAADLPRAEFDPLALAELLGNNPQKHFEWVRDRTWWAPYRGLLRGSKGVMLDRVGSNLDRAVLLGDLLRRSGHTVRLAHAQLPEDRARELLGRVRPMPDQRRNPIASKPVPAERQRASEAVMPGLEKEVQEGIAARMQRLRDANALISSQAEQLYTAVREVTTKAGADDHAALAALQDHWWVELENDGDWIAMDVLLPDATMGKALATPSDTYEWRPTENSPSILETDWHTVQIRVVVERYEGGATTESIALETTLRPANVFERPITLMHMPKPWPDEDSDSETDTNSAEDAVLNVRQWVPILQVGDDLIVQSAFTDGGDLAPISNDSVAALGAGGGLDFFGSSLGGGEEIESFATAEWIDYEIQVPGEPSKRLRRPVFDLLGPAKRSAAAKFDGNSIALVLQRFDALWSSTDILLQPCDFTEEFFSDIYTSSIVANQNELRELSRERDPARAKNLAATIFDRIDIWGPLPELALWRSALGTDPADWFVDRPNVLNYRVSRSVGNADRVALREMIDFASNSSGIRRAAAENAFNMRLKRGVTDTVAEMLALGVDLRMAENTASVFAMTSDADQRVFIAQHHAEAVRKLGWPEDATARLTDDIEAGFSAVALKQPILLHERQRVGWWRVDPDTGETIGVMDTGYHAALTEDQANRYAQGLQRYQNFANKWRMKNANQVHNIKARLARGRPVSKEGMQLLRRYEEVLRSLGL
jgi:hypothetical protein